MQQISFLADADDSYGLTEEQWAILCGYTQNTESYTITETANSDGTKTATYKNESGQIVKTVEYDTNGIITSTTDYIEQSEGEYQHTEIKRNANGKIISRYDYNDEQNSKTTIFNTDRSINYIVERKLNNNSNTTVSNTNEEISENENAEDSNNNQVIISIKSANGNVITSYIDEDGYNVEFEDDYIKLTISENNETTEKYYSYDGSEIKTIVSNSEYTKTTISNEDGLKQ